MTENNLPETFDEWCDYVLQHADSIYVRHRAPGGRSINVALADLPVKQALMHVFDWIRKGHIPVRVRRTFMMRTEEEIQRAHDVIVAILLKEVPDPFEENPDSRLALLTSASVLCWVLRHDHNKEFQTNIDRIEECLRDQGFVIRKLPEEFLH